jgi:hypothetical protein
MAIRMQTSRRALDRLLDPTNIKRYHAGSGRLLEEEEPFS